MDSCAITTTPTISTFLVDSILSHLSSTRTTADIFINAIETEGMKDPLLKLEAGSGVVEELEHADNKINGTYPVCPNGLTKDHLRANGTC